MVTVADDGGSSGRLRRELGLLPPGDLRKALAALAGEDDENSLWATVFQHRFGGTGALAGHAVGNLVLAGLLEVLGDPVAALDEAARLLGLQGRVLPMCTEPLDIEADVVGLDEDPTAVRRIRGRWRWRPRRVRCSGSGCTRRARPTTCPKACAAAVQAVLDADVVLLGPGSWFTSVLPHLLVPELHEALIDTAASRMVVLNLVPQPGETAGFSPGAASGRTLRARTAPAGRRGDRRRRLGVHAGPAPACGAGARSRVAAGRDRVGGGARTT